MLARSSRRWFLHSPVRNLRYLSSAKLYNFNTLPTDNPFNVPRLPLPALDSTVTTYLNTVRPFLSETAFADTKSKADAFLTTQGPDLHRKVEALSNRDEYPFSYVQKFWDDMYYGGRWPLMIHSNPYYIVKNPVTMQAPELAGTEKAQRKSAAVFVSSTVRWWTKVLNGELEADGAKDAPMCMAQFSSLFGLARYPGIEYDDKKCFPDSKHIVVICLNQHFKLDVLDDSGAAISAELLEARLADIQAQARTNGPRVSEDVGVLTAVSRADYAKARSAIEENDPANTSAFNDVDECLLVVVLEEDDTTSLADTSKLMLTGKDGANRWFDKHQVIVNTKGVLGLNFEHGSTDGLCWNRWIHEVWHDMSGSSSGYSPLPAESTSTAFGPATPINWKLSSSNKQMLAEAGQSALKEISNLDLHYLEFSDFGRNEIKTWGVSPDAAAQMAMQLGYTKLHSKPPPTYEACAMRFYFHGRTETIRSCSSESTDFCNEFISGKDQATKKEKFVLAAQTHVEIANGAKTTTGSHQGVDRHLFAMKCIAQSEGLDVPFFNDPIFSHSSTWRLSTSNVSMPILELFGFGAVCGDGYGIGYMTGADDMPMCITSFKSNSETNSKQFAEAVSESLHEIKQLMQK